MEHRFQDHQYVEAQHDEIANFMSASTLADNVSGPSADGGRIWSQQYASSSNFETMHNFFHGQNHDYGPNLESPPPPPPPPPPTVYPSLNSPRQPSRREREIAALDTLTKLQDRVITLRKIIVHDLRPGESVDAQTISGHKGSLRLLRQDLDSLSYGRHEPAPVRSLRDDIEVALLDLKHKLKVAETAPTPPKDSVHVNSGKFLSADCMQLKLTHRSIRPPL